MKGFSEFLMKQRTGGHRKQKNTTQNISQASGGTQPLGILPGDSSGRLVQCGGQEAYLLWCYKTIQTERDSCLAYLEEISGADLGVEMEGIPQEEDHETAESMLERTITEALEVNPRTESVGNFVFTWDGDDVHCQFEVQGVNWDQAITIKF